LALGSGSGSGSGVGIGVGGRGWGRGRGRGRAAAARHGIKSHAGLRAQHCRGLVHLGCGLGQRVRVEARTRGGG
jgi:hypothetical protein